MRLRVILISLAAVVIVALVALSLADHLLVDYLWFGRLGYRGVFDTTVGAEIAIFAIVWLVAFVAIFVSGLIAIGSSRDRERLRVVRRPDEMVEVNLPELIRALGERVPWRVIVAGGAALLALFAAQGEAASWDTYLKGLYGVPFGIVEQAFGNDIGFYVFTMPLLEEIRDLFLMLIVLAAAIAIAVYWARGALDFKESPPRVSPGAAGHLSVLLGLFFVQRAMSYWLGRFDLLLHTDGVVFGLRYVDRILWQPGLWLLVALSLAAAVMCMFNAREGGLRIPVAAFVIVFGPALIMNFIQPVIERLWVKPDELRVERPYLQRNIEATRHAYKLDTVDVKPFAGQGTLTPAALERGFGDGQEHPAVGPAPADRHLPPVAGNSHLLRFSRRRYRSLLDRGQVHRGDAVAARDEYRPAARQRADLGQSASQVHPRRGAGDEPGQPEGHRGAAGVLYQEYSGGLGRGAEG